MTELQRFMGMCNQLAKFLPNLSETNEPLRQLLKKHCHWNWDRPQENAFQQIKQMHYVHVHSVIVHECLVVSSETRLFTRKQPKIARMLLDLSMVRI